MVIESRVSSTASVTIHAPTGQGDHPGARILLEAENTLADLYPVHSGKSDITQDDIRE
jgi:hypothetical protein